MRDYPVSANKTVRLAAEHAVDSLGSVPEPLALAWICRHVSTRSMTIAEDKETVPASSVVLMDSTTVPREKAR